MLSLTDEQLAEAVVDGLAGIVGCVICGERCSQYAFIQQEQDGDAAHACCSGCVANFRKHHNLYGHQAARVLRYAAFKGWITNPTWRQKANPYDVLQRALSDKGFRQQWRN